MREYLDVVKGLANKFETFKIKNIHKNQNERADRLDRLALALRNDSNDLVLIEHLKEPLSMIVKERRRM